MFIFLGSLVEWLIFAQLQAGNKMRADQIEEQRKLEYARLKVEHPLVYAELEAQKAKREAQEYRDLKLQTKLLLLALALMILLLIILDFNGTLR